MVFLVIYLLIQLLIGYWISLRIESDQDYFLAGRSLGLKVASLSIFATWFGAETCMGSSGSIFENGLSGGRADPFGYTICLMLMAFFLAAPLRKLNLVTLGDLFRLRFTPGLEKLAVLILIPSTLIWASAQVRALAQIVTVITPLDFESACILATAFVVIYTSMGGLLGDVVHDVIQGSILILGLALILYYAADHTGGLYQALVNVPNERWSFMQPGESWLQRLDSWAIPILGSLVAQELISRVLACKSPSISRRASFLAAGIYFLIGLIPVLIGLIGPQLPFEVAHKDQFLPTIAQNLFPTTLFIIFMGALIAAILSTVDSTLLTISAFTTHNLLSHRFYYSLPEKRKLFISRLVVVVSGVVAYILASGASGIYDLVILASSFGTAGVLVITLVAVWKPSWAYQIPAWSCLIFGMFAYPVAEALELQAPFLLSILVAVLAYFIPLLGQRTLVTRRL